MFAEERQDHVATLALQRGRVSVTELAERFEVTTETVRRDLSALERRGVLRRVHGGAVPADALTATEAGFGVRDVANTEVKDRIAAAALTLLPEGGGTLVLDAGTTTARLATLLPRDRRLSVFTNGVPVAGRLADAPLIDLHLVPGLVRTTTQAAVGVDAVEALGRIRAEVVFLGTNGISLEHGLSTPDHAEAATKRAMVRCAQRTVVLADSSKLGQELATRFADLADVDVLVTDDGIDDQWRRDLETAGVEVLTA